MIPCEENILAETMENKWPLLWNRNKYPCFYIFPLEFGGVGDLHAH